MSTELKAEPMNRDRRPARDVLLAGLGAVSLLRKNAGSAWTEATAIAGRMPLATNDLIEEMVERGVAFRYEFERLGRVAGKEVSTAATSAISEVKARLQPLLRKIGDTKIISGVAVRKPKAKKAVSKRVRKAVKPVAKRAVRKARKAA
jgi:uncharacterized protein YgbK (DUF1537 family)